MDSIIEKVTLYDVLGYMLPGSLVMLAVGGKLYQGTEVWFVESYQDLNGFVWYGFILLSYLCGILLSELSRMCKRIMAWVGGKGKIERPVSNEIIIAALKKAEVINSGDTQIDVERYMSYMYSVVQTDQNYKRIHNYASAESMYKNLAFAVFLSAVIVSTYSGGYAWGNVVCPLAGGICAVVFWHRHQRFLVKKENYAVSWFVEKYLK